MADTKHTPGPWRLLRSGRKHHARISGASCGASCGASWSGFARVVVRMDGSADDSAEGVANAHLIAAAPELYSALEQLHDNIAEYARINNLGGFSNQDMRQARAALAKARGEKA